jgi:hypothetical protein
MSTGGRRTEGPTRRRLLVLSHRGHARGLPENTVDAILAGLAVPGCDGAEFDVRAARDGTPVLAHDETLLRVFGDPRRVGDLSTAELAALGVPTLHELVAALPSRAFLDVELKEDVGCRRRPGPPCHARTGPGERRRLVVQRGGHPNGAVGCPVVADVAECDDP